MLLLGWEPSVWGIQAVW